MKSAFPHIFSFFSSLNPNGLTSISVAPLLSRPQNARYRSYCSSSSSMSTTGDSQAPPQSSSPPSLENQFKEFRTQLEESKSLREKIRAVVVEIEPISKCIHVSLLLVHHCRPVLGTIWKGYFFHLCLEFRCAIHFKF